MKKYIGCLIVLLLIFVPRTNSKYVLSDAKNLGVKTPGFDVVETTNGPVEIKDYTKEYIEVKITNNTKSYVRGSITLDGVNLKTVRLRAGGTATYQVYINNTLFDKLKYKKAYTLMINYESPYKISKELTTIKKLPFTIYGKVRSLNLGNDKSLGIDFSKASSNTNGEGVYLFDETKNEANPVYYFRGTHNLNNNLIYGGFCWKIVRTTKTGGVRLIYNGKPIDWKCTTTTGDEALSGDVEFNAKQDNKKYVGYMYSDDINPYDNINESIIKKYLDSWYLRNIKNEGFEMGLDKKAIYCGDRTEKLKANNFIQYMQQAIDNKPSMNCPLNDSYSVEAGNKKLTNPIGMLTIDEAILAGTNASINNNMDFYLHNMNSYWLLSPGSWQETNIYTGSRNFSLTAGGSLGTRETNMRMGVRPVITLKGELPIFDGDGTMDKPFIMTMALSKKMKLDTLGNDKELGINYNKINSPSNGEGIYLLDESKNDVNPIVFFRGTHNLDNNLIYAGFCWKIVRTTETGGVRIIYNGKPINGKCSIITGEVTQVGQSKFNQSHIEKQYVGYMYGDDANPYENTNDSDIKKYLDSWYQNNILNKSYASKIDNKSTFCGDRSEHFLKNPRTRREDKTITLYGGFMRTFMSQNPSLKCDTEDSYGVITGNRTLKYPIGLMSIDEAVIAGANRNEDNNNFYLYSNRKYFLISPTVFRYSESDSSRFGAVAAIDDLGKINAFGSDEEHDVRPVLNLSSSATILFGDGSRDNPYII